MPLLPLFFLPRYGYTLKNLELLSDTLINRGWRGFPCSVFVICLNLEMLVNKSIQAESSKEEYKRIEELERTHDRKTDRHKERNKDRYR
jgi:hypothetical protein